MARMKKSKIVLRPISERDEKAIIKAGRRYLFELQKGKFPKRNARLALRSVLMDEMNSRGIKWNGSLVNKMTDNIIGNTQTISLRSDNINYIGAAQGGQG